MKNFLLLFKHERRSIFPSLKNRKTDFWGGLLSILFSLAIIAALALTIYSIAVDYVNLKVDKEINPITRSHEFLSAIYTVIIVALGVMCLEKLRTNLMRKTDKNIFLRLPIKQSTLFLSKFAALLLWTYTTAFLFIIPTNAIFFVILKPGIKFWIRTAIVYLLLPLASFFIATLLIVPYNFIVNFLSNRYFLMFITLSALLAGSFLAYSRFLEAFTQLVQNESPKSMFTTAFVDVLKGFEQYAYPANSLAGISVGRNITESFIICASVAVASLILALALTKVLYKLTLYKNEPRARRGRKRFIKKRSVSSSLMHKEFITVFREPKHMFSYFSIALATPFMVYCCYTLVFELLSKMYSIKNTFMVAIMVTLVFAVLTNTFCATNVTRDGITVLKSKIFPVKAAKILSAKVRFCFIISSLSIIASVAILYLLPEHALGLKDAALVGGTGIIFSLSQILIATRMDLNHAILTGSPYEISRANNRTITKTVSIGFLFALIIGFTSLFITLFVGASPSFLRGITIEESYMVYATLATSGIYFIFSVIYYRVKIEKSFNKLVR